MQQTAYKINLFHLILLLLLLTPAHSQNNLKSAEPDKDQMPRIERIVDLTQEYSLIAANTWQPFSDLQSTFELSFSQNVGINVRISIMLNTACSMKLRVLIDGVDKKPFRRQVQQTKYIVFIVNEFVWLSRGRRTIQIQYIKTGGEQTIESNRINMAFFKLDYLNKRDPARQSKTLVAESLYPINLSNNNTFQSFPFLVLTFKLDSRREVHISYKIMVVYMSQISHLVTRLMIDGREHQSFKYSTGNMNFVTNSASGIVQFQAGQHTVFVEYRTPGNVVNNYKWDWNINQLRVKY